MQVLTLKGVWLMQCVVDGGGKESLMKQPAAIDIARRLAAATPETARLRLLLRVRASLIRVRCGRMTMCPDAHVLSYRVSHITVCTLPHCLSLAASGVCACAWDLCWNPYIACSSSWDEADAAASRFCCRTRPGRRPWTAAVPQISSLHPPRLVALTMSMTRWHCRMASCPEVQAVWVSSRSLFVVVAPQQMTACLQAWCVTSLAHTPSQNGAPLSLCAGIPAARRLLEACLVDSGIDTSRLDEPGAMVAISIIAAARGQAARRTVLFSTQTVPVTGEHSN